jgi:hypothetical protein
MSTRYLAPAYSVDIQDPMVFSKPYGGPDGCPIPFETLKVKISLTHKGREVVVMHGNAFIRTLLACCLATLYQEYGDRPCSNSRGGSWARVRSMISRTHTASDNRQPALTAEVGHSHRRAARNADSTPLPRDSHRDQRNSPHSHPSLFPQQV